MEREAELIESVKSTAPWLTDWEYLPVCNVRVGCAIARHHALASRPFIRFEDIRDWTIYYHGYSDVKGTQGTTLFNSLSAQGIPLKKVEAYDVELMWKCACEPCALIAPLCFQDIMSDMVILPFEETYITPYGFYCRKDASAPVHDFLKFVIGLYGGKFKNLRIPTIPSATPIMPDSALIASAVPNLP